MKKRRCAFLGGGLLLACVAGALLFFSRLPAGRLSCKDCNVVLISLDTLSANHLPCYGYSRDTAPNLCKFGNQNMQFQNMFSNASWTLPSHVSLFTGLLPSQHHVTESFRDSLAPDTPFLPEILQKNGYKTYFYMRLGTNSLPEKLVYNRGIDELHDVKHPNDWNPGLNKLLANDRSGQKTFLFLHTYWVHMPYLLENPQRRLYTEGESAPPTLPTTKKQLYACSDEFLREFQETLSYDLGANSANFWNPPKRPLYEEIYRKLSTGIEHNDLASLHSLCDDPRYTEDIKVYIESSYEGMVNTSDAKQIRYITDAYDSKIRELDDYVQRVIDFIGNSRLKNDTILIITADHGEEFMEHGHIAHAKNLYDTTLRVPLFMKIPGNKPARLDKAAEIVDLMPTLLAILNIPDKYPSAGINLLDTKNSDPDRITRAQQISFGQQDYALRAGDWKLFYRKSKNGIVPLELFDTAKDPQEKNNLLFSDKETVGKMLQKITP